MKTDALIVANYGVAGLHNRETMLLDGKPLLEYTFQAALNATSVRNIYLSGTDGELLNRYRKHSRVTIIDRKKDDLSDNVSIKEVVLHAVNNMDKGRPDAIVILPAAAPFRTSKHIDGAVRLASSEPSFGSVAAISMMKAVPSGALSLDDKKRISAPEQRIGNSALCSINRALWVLRTDRVEIFDDLLLCDNSYGFEMDEMASMYIEEPYSLAIAEALLVFNRERFSFDARGGFNLQRLYIYDDPEMGIRRNALDKAAYERHFYRYKMFLGYINPSDQVLDIACGSGYGSQMLASRARSVHGVDADPATIEYARRHHMCSNTCFSASKIENFEPQERYDKIISVETIEHLSDPSDFLRRAKGWLRPGGEIWLTCPLSNDNAEQIENPFHISEMTYDSLNALMARYFKKVSLFNLDGQDNFRVDTLNNKTTYIIARGATAD